MNAHETPRRITARLFPDSRLAWVVRVETFLEHTKDALPDSPDGQRYARAMEILDRARARKEFVEANLPDENRA